MVGRDGEKVIWLVEMHLRQSAEGHNQNLLNCHRKVLNHLTVNLFHKTMF